MSASEILLVMTLFAVASGVRPSNSSEDACRNVVYHVQNLHQTSPSRAIEDLKRQVAAQQAKIQALEAAVKHKSPAIGFNVGLSTTQTTVPATIAFDVVTFQYGGGWNSVTKMFVAPITGLYAFHLTLMNPRAGLTTYAQILHENTVLQRAYAELHGIYNVGSASAVAKVNKGEHVYCKLMSGQAHSNAHKWTNFVGYLLQAL